MNLENVTRDDWIVAGLALLLVIALLFFPWYHVSASFGPVSVSRDAAAASSPYSIWGILALLTLLAVIADVAIERLSPQTAVPAVGGSRATTRLALVGATVLLLVIKFLAHVGSFGWGFFLCVIVLVALAYFAFVQHNAAPVGGAGNRPPPAAPGPPPPTVPVDSAGTGGAGAPPAGAPPAPGAGGSTPPPGP